MLFSFFFFYVRTSSLIFLSPINLFISLWREMPLLSLTLSCLGRVINIFIFIVESSDAHDVVLPCCSDLKDLSSIFLHWGLLSGPLLARLHNAWEPHLNWVIFIANTLTFLFSYHIVFYYSYCECIFWIFYHAKIDGGQERYWVLFLLVSDGFRLPQDDASVEWWIGC